MSVAACTQECVRHISTESEKNEGKMAAEKVFMKGVKGDVIEIDGTPDEITKAMVQGYVQVHMQETGPAATERPAKEN